MLKYFLLTIFFINTLSSSQLITQQWLNTKPRSIAKDFYIWRYLGQDITPAQAILALGQGRNINNKFQFITNTCV